MSCDASGLCCVIVSAAINSDGYALKIFNLSLSGVTLISSLYLLIRLVAARTRHIPIHFNFVVTSCITLVIVTITSLIPFPTTHGGMVAHDVIHCASLIAQWFVQIAVTIFMFGREMNASTIRRCIIIAAFLALAFGAAWSVSAYVAGCPCQGEMAIEAALSAGFLASSICAFLPQSLRYARPRPASKKWSVFQSLIHLLFLGDAVLLFVAATSEGKQCMDIVSNTLYYVLYAPMLYVTLTNDSRYFKRQRAVLADTGVLPDSISISSLEDGDTPLANEDNSLMRTEEAHAVATERTPILAQSASLSMRHAKSQSDTNGGSRSLIGSRSIPNLLQSSLLPVGTEAQPVPPEIQQLVADTQLTVINLDEIELVHLIGAGCHGEVYKAKWRRLTVAVKRYRLPVSVFQEAGTHHHDVLHQFLTEGAMMSRLRHPNVLQLLGVCIALPILCIVTEYMEQGSLFDVLKLRRRKILKERQQLLSTSPTLAPTAVNGLSRTLVKNYGTSARSNGSNDSNGEHERPLIAPPVMDSISSLAKLGVATAEHSINSTHSPNLNSHLHHTDEVGPVQPLDWKTVLKILKDVAQGMYFLHSCEPPIIHRDLKSHNLLIDGAWNSKVADFGISRVKDVTSTMTRVGTPQWMAPEVLRLERYSERADVYSFGVVIWELMSGVPPFELYNPLTVVSLVAHDGVKLQAPAYAPTDLRHLMEACCATAVEKRPDFGSILQRLDVMSEMVREWDASTAE